MNYYIPDIGLHRNETTFRHLLTNQHNLQHYGINRVFNPDDADVLLIGQASVCDKKVSLQESTEKALTLLRGINRPYAIFDGQDSTSLKGIAEIIREVRYDINFRGVFKNSLINWLLYKRPNVSGRWYWGVSDDPEIGYAVPDIDDLAQYIHLSQTNWLGTLTGYLAADPLPRTQKKYDVCALFSYEMKDNTEYGLNHSEFYNAPRRELLERLKQMNISLIYNKPGERRSIQEYYEAIRDSRCVIAPFGFGEMAPRDVEAAFFNATLIKPFMQSVITVPDLYMHDMTYVPYMTDDLERVVMDTLNLDIDFTNIMHNKMVTFFKGAFCQELSTERFVELFKGIIDGN